MANSGILWVDATYDWCVLLLVEWASLLGISYEEINVWLFVIIGPAALLVSMLINVAQWQQNKRIREKDCHNLGAHGQRTNS